MRSSFGVLVIGLLVGVCAAKEPAGQRGDGVPAFYVRDGYRVTIAATGLDEARFIEFDDQGTLYVSQPGGGVIIAMRENKPQGTYALIGNYVSNVPTVHGMCFHNGWLWFTQTGAIHKARGLKPDGSAAEVVTVIPEGKLPKAGGHWWRSILVTSDSIYTSIGDSGNITDETGNERQKIWRFDLNGENKRLFASGLRNTEKLRLRPGTTDLWGCDHGSDSFGSKLGEQFPNQPVTDRVPPCEFNHYVEGGFYGHPFIVGNGVPRIEYQNRPDILELAAKTTAPAWTFGAHWAPNAFTFLTKDYFPGHKGDAFVALHGSWNSSVKVGYRVERVIFDPETGRPMGAQRIVGTLTEDGKTVLARPVDCVEAPDGSVLFSCDFTRKIYRISRAEQGK